jgi:catechol 2,3-dioxygenase-like lactoylglutathione lyase family enzyme
MAGAKAKTKKKPPAKAAKPAPRRPAPKPVSPPRAAAVKPVAQSRPAAKPAAPPKPVQPVAAIPTPTPVHPPAAPKPFVSPKPLEAGAFTLDKLHQVALTATNLDHAVEFYRDVLGLKFMARFDPPGLAFFALSGGARLLLSVQASQATLYFIVPDIDAAVATLKKRGVSFLQPPHRVHRDEAGDFGKKGSEEWMAFLRDPSGNLIGLVERR